MNEFVSLGGDSNTIWEIRRHKIVNILSKILKEATLIATQENDHPYWILRHLQKNDPNIRMFFWTKPQKPGKMNTSAYLYISRLYDKLCERSDFTRDENIDVKEQYEQMNAYLQDKEDVRNQLTSEGFTCTLNGEEFLSGEKINAQDLYWQAEGLALYYRSDLVTLESKVTSEMVQCEFKLRGGPTLTVFPMHLTSGESEKKEIRRVKELKAILQLASGVSN